MEITMQLKFLKQFFFETFAAKPEHLFFSPSRINIIGEHIDYNGGKVFPCAIQIGTYGAARKRGDNVIKLVSKNFSHYGEISLNEEILYQEEHQWMNYPMGVVRSLKERGYSVGGMDIVVWGNIPNGAGLSSSASLELLIGEMINQLYNDGTIPKMELVYAGKDTENKFIGLQSGIMDQFVIGMGRKDNAVLLDTNTLDFKYVPLNLHEYTFVIMNTNKRRELKDSKYNERRRECDKALEILQQEFSVRNLCELPLCDCEKYKKLLHEENLYKRVYHVIFENQRVYLAMHAIKENRLSDLGKLLSESHRSLKEYYEVTGKELDCIVNAAQSHADCLGARMTGAGFGGCAIALVKKDKTDQFIQEVSKKYTSEIGYEAEFLISGISDSVHELPVVE